MLLKRQLPPIFRMLRNANKKEDCTIDFSLRILYCKLDNRIRSSFSTTLRLAVYCLLVQANMSSHRYRQALAGGSSSSGAPQDTGSGYRAPNGFRWDVPPFSAGRIGASRCIISTNGKNFVLSPTRTGNSPSPTNRLFASRALSSNDCCI